MENDYVLENIRNFDAIKGNIYPKLINTESNREYLSDKPYTPMEDLAVVYKVIIGKPEEYNVSSVTITNDMMQQYGISVEDLHKVAVDNISKEEGLVKPLGDMIAEMVGAEMDPEYSGMDNCPFLVVTNKERVGGATEVLNPKTMQKVSEMINGDYMVIPSSVNEVLIIGDSFAADRIELNDLIKSVNNTQVAPDEVLSDHVYRYDSKNHTLTMDMENSAWVSVYRDNILHDEHTDTVDNTAELKVDKTWLLDWVKSHTDYESLENFLKEYDHDLMDEARFYESARDAGAILEAVDAGMGGKDITDIAKHGDPIIGDILNSFDKVPRGNGHNPFVTLQIIPSKTSLDVDVKEFEEKLKNIKDPAEQIKISKVDGFGRMICATFSPDVIASIEHSEAGVIYKNASEQAVQKKEMTPKEKLKNVDEAYAYVQGYAIHLQRTEEGIDYTIYGKDMLQKDGGVYDLRTDMDGVLEDIMSDLTEHMEINGGDKPKIVTDKVAVESANLFAEQLNKVHDWHDIKGFTEQVATMIRTNTAWTAEISYMGNDPKNEVESLVLYGPEYENSTRTAMHPMAVDIWLDNCSTIFNVAEVIADTLNNTEESYKNGIVPNEKDEWKHLNNEQAEKFSRSINDVYNAFDNLCETVHLKQYEMSIKQVYMTQQMNNNNIGVAI